MTDYAHEFGQRWRTKTPRAAIKLVVGAIHVGEPDDEVKALVINRIARSRDKERFTPSIINECVAYGLLCHRRNRDFYLKVMGGRV